MSINPVALYEVGGCIRDEILGIPTKDVDFTVTADSYEAMIDYLKWNNFEIFLETPQYSTARARFPRGMEKWGNRTVAKLTADFVYARVEGPYTDGRHPDWVRPGTLQDDLSRRDFTMNALAKDSAGKLIDPFNGKADIDRRLIRCVGSAEDRLREDALRALRALRFAVTKGFTLDDELWVTMRSDWLPPLIAKVSVERRQQELLRAFKYDTLEALYCLNQLSQGFREATFSDGLWLKPALEQ